MSGDYPRFDAERFRYRRYCLGLSLRAVARAIEQTGHSISHSSLSRIDRGLVRPRPETLALLAGAVQLEPEELLIQSPHPASHTPVQATP